MSNMTKQFHIGDILSITTGCMLSPSRTEGIHKILDFITNEGIYWYQIPRVRRKVAPELRRQFPQFASVHPPEINSWEEADEWVSEQAEKFGEWHDVTPMRKATDLALLAADKATKKAKEAQKAQAK